MSHFKIHTSESAPAKSMESLRQVEEKYHFVPNILGLLAEAPTALEAYLQLGGLFERSSFSAIEQQVVILTVSFENECSYCMAAHSSVAKMLGVPPDFLSALRQGQPLRDARLEALRRFTSSLVQERGWVSDSELEAFLSAGFTRAQVFEAILGVVFKTLSNYSNHVGATPLDSAFASERWKPPAASAAKSSTA